MKRTDIRALHEKTISELQKQLAELQKQLATARLQKSVGKLANITSLRTMRTDVARIKTVLGEKTKVAAKE